MLESEIGNPAIITGPRDFPPANSKSCSNAPGFLGVTELGGPLLLRNRLRLGLRNRLLLWERLPLERLLERLRNRLLLLERLLD